MFVNQARATPAAWFSLPQTDAVHDTKARVSSGGRIALVLYTLDIELPAPEQPGDSVGSQFEGRRSQQRADEAFLDVCDKQEMGVWHHFRVT